MGGKGEVKGRQLLISSQYEQKYKKLDLHINSKFACIAEGELTLKQHGFYVGIVLSMIVIRQIKKALEFLNVKNVKKETKQTVNCMPFRSLVYSLKPWSTLQPPP